MSPEEAGDRRVCQVRDFRNFEHTPGLSAGEASPHQHLPTGDLSRRGLLKAADGLTAAVALGAAPAVTTAVVATPADRAPATFTHPGMLHNANDINRAKARVAAGTDPWLRARGRRR